MTPAAPLLPGMPGRDSRQGSLAAPGVEESADLFAQLLAAGASPGSVSPALCASAAVDSAALPDPVPQARRFNEDGMLGHAIDAPVVTFPAPRFAETAIGASCPPQTDKAAEAELPLTRTITVQAPDGGPPVVLHMIRAQPVPQQAPMPHASLPPAMRTYAPAPLQDEPAVAAADRQFPRSVSAAQASIQVALHELDRGLQVTAQVDALDEAERRQLHDEIAALLARHGLSAEHIHIRANAPGRTSR